MLGISWHASDNYIAAFTFGILGFAAFSFMDAASKTLSSSHSLPQVLFFTGVFAIIFGLLMAKPLGGFKIHSAKGWAVVCARGLLSVAMIWLTLYAISRMPIADVYSIRFTSPLITMFLALAFLNERPVRGHWLSACVGLAGVLLVLQPSGVMDRLAVFMAFAAAFAQSASTIMVRRWRTQSTPLADTMLPVIILVLITGILLPDRYTPPTQIEWLLYIGAGALLAIGRLCLTLSIRMAQSSIIAPLQYTQLLWSLLFGYLFFSEQPLLVLWVGYCLILVSGGLGIMARRKTSAAR
ncbi:DMT family transporter [Agrobacterium sp. B1(2019)]|uniref:DMT family transporter n=1 Tax=Agrobacterium sp. B1(2019) TaxID=2607032 RepID=UPI0011ED8DDD|nr:DMT family transporter [Agrobacterium sp. B1(2019)]TZG36581.1 DMT family transporter [Agrobacterium sp. B1(2019)]